MVFRAISASENPPEGINVSSYGSEPYNSFSPFTYRKNSFSSFTYDNGEIQIPVPKQENVYSKSVEGIWQGLKIIDDGSEPYNSFSPPTYRKNSFSPFTYGNGEIQIPVPKQENVYSKSVEGIWQGLKIIDGSVDFSLFDNRPKKRKGNVEGHRFGNKVLGLIDARKQIFIPSYEHFLKFCIPDELKDDLLLKGVEREVLFYDVESNLDIDDPSSPFAHSSALSDYFNKLLDSRISQIKGKLDGFYRNNDLPHETLAEPLARVKIFYEDSNDLQRALINSSLRSPSKGNDKFENRYYKRLVSLLR